MVEHIVFKLRVGYGRGTNTRGELLVIWCLLYFAHLKHLTHLQSASDSKVIIDWMTKKGRLQVAQVWNAGK